jgi:hypothetical protein
MEEMAVVVAVDLRADFLAGMAGMTEITGPTAVLLAEVVEARGVITAVLLAGRGVSCWSTRLQRAVVVRFLCENGHGRYGL